MNSILPKTILPKILRGFQRCPDGLYRLTVQFRAPITLVINPASGKLTTEKTLIPVDINRGKCRINNT